MRLTSRPVVTDPRRRPLENNANNCTPPSERRKKRYELRAFLWRESTVGRCRKCGRMMTGQAVGVRYSPELGAGFSGLSTCGSVWVCPVCSAKILARRSVETGVLMLAWENRGGALALGTLTMRHNAGHSLEAVWDALAAAWHSVIRSRVWAKWRQRLGSPGLVKVVEVNWGVNGWHVHIHYALLLCGGATDADLSELSAWLVPKWQRAVRGNGFDALPIGQELHLVTGVDAAEQLGEYMTKATAYGASGALGRELFGAASKRAQEDCSTVPVWRLLEDIVATGELGLWQRWCEYERVSKGRRQYSVSRGLRELLGVGPEKSDEEIAAEEVGDRDLVLITREGWSAMLRASWSPVAVLELMEQAGVGAVCAFLRQQGIDHEEVLTND